MAKSFPRWQQMAVFGFGCLFITVLMIVAAFTPAPSTFQIFVFRVVLALAAAGIASLVPGFFELEIPGIKAGGALAVFGAVLYVNPPELINPQFSTAYQERVSAGMNALVSMNYPAALRAYEEAQAVFPDGVEAAYGLGRAHYQLEDFKSALASFRRAFSLSNEKDGNLANATAMALEATGDYESAAGFYHKASELLGQTSEYGKHALYDEGLMSLILWLDKDAPADSNRSSKAQAHLGRFLELDGKPQRWARYHLACLDATRASNSALAAESQRKLRELALAQFKQACDELEVAVSAKATAQRSILSRLIRFPTAARPAGNPVGCPALVELWQASGDKTLLERIS